MPPEGAPQSGENPTVDPQPLAPIVGSAYFERSTFRLLCCTLRCVSDVFSRAKRSEVMRRIRSSHNRSTELALIRSLRKARIHGWRRRYPLKGRPDFVFPKHRLALFVDGCFWHGCPRCYQRPKSHRKYWDDKRARNRHHDSAIARLLRRRGWQVMRLWEHALRESPQTCACRIRRRLMI